VVWWPFRSETASERDQLAQIQAEQLTLVATLDELNAATDLLGGFDADLERFAIAIPETLELPTFLRELDAQADAAGVQIDLVSPSEVLGGATRDSKRPVPPGMSSVSLSLTGQGPFESTMEFVNRLDDLPRLIVVDTLGLSAVDGNADQIIIDLELRVFTTETLVGSTASSEGSS
jgi:Tfp pilus assembly protein PilO